MLACGPAAMSIRAFDHVAIPTARPLEMLAFYAALGFSVPDPEAWRESGVPFFSIQFGDNKINVHAPELWRSESFTLRGPAAQPGCGDFCFVWEADERSLHAALERASAEIVAGPVELVGARASGTARGISIYTRDPDGNLLEFIRYAAT